MAMTTTGRDVATPSRAHPDTAGCSGLGSAPAPCRFPDGLLFVLATSNLLLGNPAALTVLLQVGGGTTDEGALARA